MKFIIPALMSFVVTYFATPIVIHLSKKYHCLDVPDKRKFHAVSTPRWGGIAMFIAVATAMLTSFDMDRRIVSYLIASLMIVCIGMIDDWRPLGWKIKMGAITAAVTVVVFGGGAVVHRIGIYDSIGTVELGAFSVPFTYIGVIGVTNAINLLDGLNGLAAGTSLLGFLFIGITAAMSGNYTVAAGSAIFIGATAAFLPYNFPRAKTFMGDTGSLLLGFSLAVFSIHLTQDARSPVNPMYPFLVLLLPIFDALRVMINRLVSLKNPFKADKGHLHHLIVRKKISPMHAVLFLWSLTVVFGGLALMLAERTSAPYLVVALGAVLLLGLFAESLTWRRQARWAIRWDMYLQRLRPRWTGRYSHPAQAGGDPVLREAVWSARVEPPAAALLSSQEFQFQRRYKVSEDHRGLHGLRGERLGHLFTSAAHHEMRRPVYGRRYHKKAGPSLQPDAEVW
jgi:UDP-GlcNAc:undecaprenyl-phosphate GlcNAc-1-phosphate transferase